MKIGGKNIKNLNVKDILKEMGEDKHSSGKMDFIKESIKVSQSFKKNNAK